MRPRLQTTMARCIQKRKRIPHRHNPACGKNPRRRPAQAQRRNIPPRARGVACEGNRGARTRSADGSIPTRSRSCLQQPPRRGAGDGRGGGGRASGSTRWVTTRQSRGRASGLSSTDPSARGSEVIEHRVASRRQPPGGISVVPHAAMPPIGRLNNEHESSRTTRLRLSVLNYF